MKRNLFPKWFNALPTIGAIGSVGALFFVVYGGWYYLTPSFWEVGYMPTQPGGGFSHQIHAGKLGMDCRYCHSNVETSPEANIPPVATCYGCHADGRLNAEISTRIQEKTTFIRAAHSAGERYDEIEALREAGDWEAADQTLRQYEQQELPVVEGGASIQWRRVHKLPDYVRNFPHNVHVNAGVSCYSCHGQITAMPIVYQAESLSMGWCLECHRGVQDNPEKYLVPKDRVTQLKWVEEAWPSVPNAGATAQALYEAIQNEPPQNCGACHY